MSLEENVQIFLKQTPPINKKLLLGFSGGEDSLALAHCFLALRVPFELAHFDHGWRESSREEAKTLERWAVSLGIEFHTKRCQNPVPTELAARFERYQFFEELFVCSEFEALILAHHQQDQAETILKRVFEGAHLTKLRGIDSVSYKGPMPIWRPLLKTPKSSIRRYIEKHKLIPIDDETNRDVKYLRGKMRTSLFPKISKEYGKEITPSLIRLGGNSKKLDAYLRERIQPFSPIQGPFGWMWEFSSAHPFEVEYAVTSFFRDLGFVPSHYIVDGIVEVVRSKKANHQFEFAGKKLIVDRGRLFWLLHPIPHFHKEISLKEWGLEGERWRWKIAPSLNSNYRGGWLAWWRGEMTFSLPGNECQLAPANSRFCKIFNECKVPAFLRPSLPIPQVEKSVLKKFLKGEEKLVESLGEPCFTITLELKIEV